jgi:NTP pyrophosphatase (non-canonical NTP hydrolase)
MAARLAAVNVAMIRGSFGARTPDWRFVTGVAEEAGEFVGAYNRFSGTSRRTGTKEEMAKELADVVLTAYMAADVLGIDLDHMVAIKAEIMRNRGWRDAR